MNKRMQSIAGVFSAVCVMIAGVALSGCTEDDPNNETLPLPTETSPGSLPHEADPLSDDNTLHPSSNTGTTYNDHAPTLSSTTESIPPTDPELADLTHDFALYHQQAAEQLTGETDALGALTTGLHAAVNPDADADMDAGGYQVQMDETSRILMQQAQEAHQSRSVVDPDSAYPQVPPQRQPDPNVPEQPGMEPEQPAQ